MSHQPKRGDDVETWLKKWRDDAFAEFDTVYWTIDAMLDEYRLRADTGLTLDRPISEAGR